jgi:hypothetical protein
MRSWILYLFFFYRGLLYFYGVHSNEVESVLWHALVLRCEKERESVSVRVIYIYIYIYIYIEREREREREREIKALLLRLYSGSRVYLQCQKRFGLRKTF